MARFVVVEYRARFFKGWRRRLGVSDLGGGRRSAHADETRGCIVRAGMVVGSEDRESGKMENREQHGGGAQRRSIRSSMWFASHDSLAPSLTGSKTRRFS